MDSIDFLEHGGGHFHVRIDGELIALPDPRTRHYQWVLSVLAMGHVPGTPNMKEWQRRLAFDRWCAAWDLPDFKNAQRLAYLVDHYRAPIAHDISVIAHQDLGELWRGRRWMLLLDILDRLPATSWYSASVSTDEEHAKMMAEAMEGKTGPGDEKRMATAAELTIWTPEVRAITDVLDATRGVQHAVIAVQAPKDKQPKAPDPVPRPITPLQAAMKRVEFNRRKAAHEALVARVLPNKRKPKDPVH